MLNLPILPGWKIEKDALELVNCSAASWWLPKQLVVTHKCCGFAARILPGATKPLDGMNASHQHQGLWFPLWPRSVNLLRLIDCTFFHGFVTCALYSCDADSLARYWNIRAETSVWSPPQTYACMLMRIAPTDSLQVWKQLIGPWVALFWIQLLSFCLVSAALIKRDIVRAAPVQQSFLARFGKLCCQHLWPTKLLVASTFPRQSALMIQETHSSLGTRSLELGQQCSSAGNLPSPRRELYYGLSDSSVGHHGPALRSGHWKLIVGTGGGSGDHPPWWRRYGVCVWQLGICWEDLRRSEKLVERAYSVGTAYTLFQYAIRGYAHSSCICSMLYLLRFLMHMRFHAYGSSWR